MRINRTKTATAEPIARRRSLRAMLLCAAMAGVACPQVARAGAGSDLAPGAEGGAPYRPGHAAADDGTALWLAPRDAALWDIGTLRAGQEEMPSPPDRAKVDTPEPVETDAMAASDDAMPARWADHVPRAQATHPTFGSQVSAIKTEALVMFGYFTIRAGSKLFRETRGFRFKDEGWFGKDTEYVGVDKMAHAWNSYLAAEILHNRLHRKGNASQGDAITAATLAFGFMAYNELSDAIEPDSGYSMQDIVMNGLGAGFSVIRNTVPGVKEKVAFKIEIMPNEEVWTYSGPKRFHQQRFLFALKGSGFEALKDTPLRYLDMQLGYYASDFLPEDRAAGIEPKRHAFVGVGLNVGELLFGGSRSKVGKAAWSALDYWQMPYTSLRMDQQGDLVF